MPGLSMRIIWKAVALPSYTNKWMKKIIAVLLAACLLFSISGCSTHECFMNEVIRQYRLRYEKPLQKAGIHASVEVTEDEAVRYYDKSGNVLSIMDENGTEYQFFYARKEEADCCYIPMPAVEEPDTEGKPSGFFRYGLDDGYKIKFRIWFQKNGDIITDISVDSLRIGICSIHYKNGNFEPESIQQLPHEAVVSCLSIEEITSYYEQACEYYAQIEQLVQDAHEQMKEAAHITF